MRKIFPVEDLARDDRFVRVHMAERIADGRNADASRRNAGPGRLTPDTGRCYGGRGPPDDASDTTGGLQAQDRAHRLLTRRRSYGNAKTVPPPGGTASEGAPLRTGRLVGPDRNRNPTLRRGSRRP